MKRKRNIISIQEELCNGCGICVQGCHEGALQLINGKARIVSELYCDGLGACIGDCPQGAITIEERWADSYDEIAVMERIFPKGEQTILAHLKHLKEHGETAYLNEGILFLKERTLSLSADFLNSLADLLDRGSSHSSGCPGSRARTLAPTLKDEVETQEGSSPSSPPAEKAASSELRHWPIQLHLLNPQSSFLKEADLLLAADCTAYTFADFHNQFLKGKCLAIACPKLDSNKEVYRSKITEMIEHTQIRSLTLIIMEVPCCFGLVQLAKEAAEQSSIKIPIRKIVITVEGAIKEDSWI